MADIQSATAEIRASLGEEKKKIERRNHKAKI